MEKYEELKAKLESYKNVWKFIHIYKTGGASLREAIHPGYFDTPKARDRSGHFPNHCTVKQVLRGRGYFGKKATLDTCFFWSSVRNPYDRFLSSYFFMKQHDAPGNKICPAMMWINANCPDFHTYAKTFSTWFPKIIDKNALWSTQFDCITVNGKNALDYMVRFENLAEEWEIIKRLFKAKVPTLGTIHKTKHKPWQEHYSPELRDIVYNHYKADFELLGYER